MDALLLLVACLALGALIARHAHPPIGLAQALNWWVLNVALPALVLVLVPRLRFDPSLWFLVASQWLVFLGSWAVFAGLGRLLGWNRGRTGAMVLICGLGNTAFIGYPLIDALRGHEGLALAVIADQIGCFMALAVGGAAVAALYSGQQPRPLEILRRIALFPPFLAFVAACGVGVAGGWPTLAEQVLERIGQTLTPLALFSVGLRLKLGLTRDQALPVALGLSWKLLLAPLLVLLLGVASGAGGLTLRIGVLEAAMAPMVSAAILADQHRLDPPLANAVLGIGILLSFASVYAWHLALG